MGNYLGGPCRNDLLPGRVEYQIDYLGVINATIWVFLQ